MKKKVISKGEKVTPNTLNVIFKKKNPDSQIMFIMKIMNEILINNIDIIDYNSNANSFVNNINNSINNINSSIKENITWELLKKKYNI